MDDRAKAIIESVYGQGERLGLEPTSGEISPKAKNYVVLMHPDDYGHLRAQPGATLNHDLALDRVCGFDLSETRGAAPGQPVLTLRENAEAIVSEHS